MINIPEHITLTKSRDKLYILTNTITQSYVKVGEFELQFLSKLYINDESIDDSFTEEQRQYLYENYKKLGFLSEEDSYSLIKKKSKSDLSRIYLFRKDPTEFFRNNKWLYKGKHIPLVLILMGLVVIFAAELFISNIKNWTNSINLTDINFTIVISMYLLILITIFFHELAHAVTCYYFGGKVKEVGIMLLYMNPSFYCDVSSIYLFNKKLHRLLVLLAGVLSQVFLSSVAIIIGYFMYLNGLKIDIIIYYIAFNIINVLLNLSPVIKLDGYWILVQLTDITNLREKSFKYVLSYTKDKYKPYRISLLGKEKFLFFSYGVIGIFGTYLIWIYSAYLIGKITYNYLGYWGNSIFIAWIIVLIIHIAKRIKKYSILLNQDIIYK
ncbi:M50 family metallopeptidase [Priestia filamentosa]|uniref:hypothetical protein n=1 Tax=Priestia filamentosa TaxID=1402861 RepID=UPI0039833C71